MELKNLDKVKDSIRKFHNADFKHYFVVDRPSWDDQHIYYEINYNVESDLFFGGYVEICSLITDDELNECISKIKEHFDLPFKKWERVLVEYSA